MYPPYTKQQPEHAVSHFVWQDSDISRLNRLNNNFIYQNVYIYKYLEYFLNFFLQCLRIYVAR